MTENIYTKNSPQVLVFVFKQKLVLRKLKRRRIKEIQQKLISWKKDEIHKYNQEKFPFKKIAK